MQSIFGRGRTLTPSFITNSMTSLVSIRDGFYPRALSGFTTIYERKFYNISVQRKSKFIRSGWSRRRILGTTNNLRRNLRRA
jgi:hypothetical protein